MKLSSRVAPPRTIFKIRFGSFNTNWFIITVPSEIPIKCDFLIFKLSKTSKTSFKIDSNEILSLDF